MHACSGYAELFSGVMSGGVAMPPDLAPLRPLVRQLPAAAGAIFRPSAPAALQGFPPEHSDAEHRREVQASCRSHIAWQ